MTSNSAKINVVQLFMIFSLMNGLNSHVIINPMLLDASGRDAWIPVLLSVPPYILLCCGIVWMMRKANASIPWRDWIANSSHPALSWAIMVPVVVILYGIGATTVIYTTSWNAINYMPATPTLLIALALVVICIVLTFWGMSTVAIASGVLLPVVIMLGIFVSVFNIDQKDHRLLTPILEQGWQPVLHGFPYVWSGLIETILLVLFQDRLLRKVKYWHILIYGLFTALMVAGPIIGGITEFGPEEAANQMTSPYEQWRLVKIGQFIEHVDFFSIFQWLSGACIRVSVAALLLVDLLPLKRNAARNGCLAAILCSYLVLAILPINNYSFYLWMYRYGMPLSLTMLAAVAAAWLIIAWQAKPAKEAKTS